MKVMPLLNYSEEKVLRIAETVLGAPKYRVFAKVRMADALKAEVDELSYADQSFLSRAHFDFVVIDGKSKVPLFAIEFDGRHHNDAIQVRRDIQKNRLCYSGHFPLLRVGNAHLYEHDQATLLEFMLCRYAIWPAERKRLMGKIGEYVSTLTKEELAALTEGGAADPSIDPTFHFDLDHPFPGIARVSQRLYERFGIVTLFQRADQKGPLLCRTLWAGTTFSPLCVATCAYVLYRPKGTPDFNFESGLFNEGDGAKLYEGTVQFGMRWLLPVVEDWQPDEAPFDYFSRKHQLPFLPSEPPGIHIPDIVKWFVEYIALCRVEAWAVQHLEQCRRREDP